MRESDADLGVIARWFRFVWTISFVDRGLELSFFSVVHPHRASSVQLMQEEKREGGGSENVMIFCQRRGHRDCLGSSNDSGLIDSLATIDNFAPIYPRPWIINYINYVRLFRLDPPRCTMAQLSTKNEEDEKWWKKKILTVDFTSEFILLGNEKVESRERERERIFWKLILTVEKSFNYNRLISGLVIIYQL